MEQVPVFRPLIEDEEIAAAVASLELGWLGMGSSVKEFEDAVAAVCGLDESSGRAVVAVSTGHAALHLALLSMGVGAGDEVITPSFNNAADFQAIRACGADPVFVDIDENTLCINPDAVRDVVSERSRCIIAMDYDLALCDHRALASISQEAGVPVLHDAAHSFGSFYGGTPTGNQHPFTMFSFDPVKTVTCIDGGALVVNDLNLVAELQAMRLIGMTQAASMMYTNSRAWQYDVEALGFRYHMANLHGAVGVAQIAKLAEIRATRQGTCRAYSRAFSDLDWLIAPSGDFLDVNPFLYFLRIQDGRRQEFRDHLLSKGIDSGIHWAPGHKFSFFRDCRRGPLDVTEAVSSEIVSLPLHSKMTRTSSDRVIDAVRTFSS